MQIENHYDFCKRLLEVHKKNRRNPTLSPDTNEFVFEGPVRILMPRDAGEVIETAARDFADYLFTSQNVTAFVDYDNGKNDGCFVRLAINTDLGEASERRGHRLTVGEGVLVEGFDECGVQQALYYCEDIMNLREAPFLKKGTETRRIMFVPRLAMSGYGYSDYPDNYLALLAHHGFTALQLWIRGVNECQKGFMNFKDVAIRAARHGIDIYVESYSDHNVYPQGEEAQAYYDKLYGDLLAECPFIKGFYILGEAVNFASRDPRIPEGTRAGWFPCNDWPLLLNMIRKAVDKVKPGVEIVLSSYNWSGVDADLRHELVSQLPKDTILQTVWENNYHYDLYGMDERCADYSLRVIKPSYAFVSESASATEFGLRVEAITNTGGKTWDFGPIPYDPAPYRWAEKFEEMRLAHDHNNLSSLLDSIHYGVTPSFISEIAKWAFAEPRVDLNAMIPKILAMHFGHEEIEKIDRAMHLSSEALANMVPTHADQYGALRTGPAHPFYSSMDRFGVASAPQDKFASAKLGLGMYEPNYFSRETELDERLPRQIKAYEHVRDCLKESFDLLSSVKKPNDELQRLTNMIHFMYRTILTVLHRKHYFILSKAKLAETDKKKKNAIIDEMIALLRAEQQNARATIPITAFDSNLGFEPSLEYITDPQRLEWKINQVEEEIAKINSEREACSLN